MLPYDTSSARGHKPNKSIIDHSMTPAVFDVYDISADKNFIYSLAQGVLDEVGNNVLDLADYTIILPNRANAQALREAFVDLSKGVSAILPNIYTPRDFDDEKSSLKIAHDPILSEALMDLPPAISALQRKLLLSKEILQIDGMASSPEKAIRLAEELARFLDFSQKYGVELNNLEKLVPEEFSEQWNKTRDFLNILNIRWPEILEEQGMIDSQERKNAVTGIQAAHWMQTPTQNKVIMAGFTGASYAERDLFSAVANLPNGRIVFSGIDYNLDDESWEVIDKAHPQYGVKQILDSLDIERHEIREWKVNAEQPKSSRSPNVKATINARKKLVSEIMRPAETSDRWLELEQGSITSNKNNQNIIDVRALTGMDLETCSTPQQEANIIALKMRECLEHADKTIALVTTDKTLSRRVAARLKYWDINIEDSIGTSLSDTKTGIWLRLTAAMAADNLSPITLLSCLKHPYATMGHDREVIVEKVQMLEDHLLKGSRPEAGVKGLEKRLSTVFNKISERNDARTEDKKKELEQLKKWLNGINKTTLPFLDIMCGEKKPFAELLDRHIEFAEMMADEAKITGSAKLWTGDTGSRASNFLVDVRKYADCLPDMTGVEYSGVIGGLMKSITIKSKRDYNSNLHILTPREARLFKADTMIIGGLNENLWPNMPNEINWLSRDMLEQVGLPSADIHLGKSANDFAQIISSPDVLLTRAERDGNVPTVASPFLTRLSMVLEKTDMLDRLNSKSQLSAINDALDTPAKILPITPPEPLPPKNARPKTLSVSAVEMLLRDPYSFYARQILKLYPREKLDAEPSAGERGNFIHDALDEFVKKYPDEMPNNAYDELLDIGKKVFDERLDNPSVRAFWWPRFEYMAKWFVKEEVGRREHTHTLSTEAEGKLNIYTKKGKFTLTAIADRIDRMSDDKLSIIDYKTGTIPAKSSVARGFSPQLTLEGLIALGGGFKGIDASEIGTLEYWKLSGGKPAGKVIPINEDINKMESEALEGLTALMETFANEETPYLDSPRPRIAPRFNRYKHLSREDEWKHESRNKRNKQKPQPPKQ